MAVAALLGVAVSVYAHGVPPGGGCHVPPLSGLTVSVARERLAHNGCAVRFKGAALKQDTVQTIARQSPPAGRRSAKVTLWLNPVCTTTRDYLPRIKEPLLTAGPTELVSGSFRVGGPLVFFSRPRCELPEPSPEGQAVQVMNAAGVVVAAQTATPGHFVEIPLPPGSYEIASNLIAKPPPPGKFTIQPALLGGQSVVIPPGYTVRQDFFFPI